ncbi:MAG: hypothetical protein LBG81_02210 [Coriobacteriaceae bacterium]|jgi:hypothetical protein|nr:hypothetical protein [Coriobacteriaceae bacterium]
MSANCEQDTDAEAEGVQVADAEAEGAQVADAEAEGDCADGGCEQDADAEAEGAQRADAETEGAQVADAVGAGAVGEEHNGEGPPAGSVGVGFGTAFRWVLIRAVMAAVLAAFPFEGRIVVALQSPLRVYLLEAIVSASFVKDKESQLRLLPFMGQPVIVLRRCRCKRVTSTNEDAASMLH